MSHKAETPTREYIILETTAPGPAPKISATRLISAIPIKNHTNAPTNTRINAIIEVVFIKPSQKDYSQNKVFYTKKALIKAHFLILTYQSLYFQRNRLF